VRINPGKSWGDTVGFSGATKGPFATAEFCREASAPKLHASLAAVFQVGSFAVVNCVDKRAAACLAGRIMTLAIVSWSNTQVFSPCCMMLRLVLRNPEKNNRGAVWELSNKREVTTHCLNRLPQRGKQEVAALFETRNTVLRYAERLSDADLRKFARLPKLAQSHLLCNQVGGARFDSFPLRRTQLPDLLIHIRGHGYFLSFFSRAT
jgi:hypothetical protein